LEIHEIARWTAWPSFLCYSIAVGLQIGPRPGDSTIWSRRFSIVGWVTLIIHIAIAMGTVHHWSLAEAVRHTAQQTQAAVGWNWGGGVWLNFATVAVWGWTLWPASQLGPTSQLQTTGSKWLNWSAQWYIAFMMFNATAVFGSRAAQAAGGLICVALFWRYLTPETPR
jgi:hypothetical protein